MKSRIIPTIRSSGIYSQQAHRALPEKAPYEREISQGGFYGAATHMHHQHKPTGWKKWQGPLGPQAFDFLLTSACDNPLQSPLLLSNKDCQISFWKSEFSMKFLVSNVDGDVLLFVHKGQGELFCDYGHITVEAGDYILIPRSTYWRFEQSSELQILIIESTESHFFLPDKGLLGRHAIFDPAVLQQAEIDEVFLRQQGENPWQVFIKKDAQQSCLSYDYNPLDALGWHGDVCVLKLSWKDINPVVSHSYHMPPSVHTTFESEFFVVCTFVPRPIETAEDALKVPFFHNNNDFDELIFYHQGDFFSRDNISPGTLSFHPRGFTHGPHPKAFAIGKEAKRTFTDEVAVMIDTQKNMTVMPAAEMIAIQGYEYSWREG